MGKSSPEARVWSVHLLEQSLRQIKMYKRQFYCVDHADNNGDEASSADSSSLDTDSDASPGDEEKDGCGNRPSVRSLRRESTR